jgi:hypothetical protein
VEKHSLGSQSRPKETADTGTERPQSSSSVP